MESLNNQQKKLIKNRLSFLKQNLRYKEITFVIEHEPKTSKRPRKGKFGFYVPDAAKTRKEILALVEDQIKDFELIPTEIHIDIKTYAKMPDMPIFEQFLAEKKIIRPTVTPDVDNYSKTYLDAFKNKLWVDDGQITDMRTRKYYSKNPRIEIRIRWATAFTSRIMQQRMTNQIEGKNNNTKRKGAIKNVRSDIKRIE